MCGSVVLRRIQLLKETAALALRDIYVILCVCTSTPNNKSYNNIPFYT